MSAVVAQHLDRVRAGFGRLDSLSWRATTVLIVACALVALAIRIWVNGEIQAPYILTDELQYAAAAEKLAHEGDLPPASHGFLYPVLIAPSWLADSATSAYSWAKSLNVVLMTLAVVPLFLWARRVVSPALALVAAVLVLVLPSFIYSGTIMTENAFFPAFVLATYAIARALERPTVRGQVFALAAIALAIAVRQQGVVLILVLASAIPLKVFFDLRADGDRATWKLLAPMVGRYRVLVGALGLSLIGYLMATVARGASVGSGLGAYEAAIGAEYDVRDAVRWVVFHFGELALTSGVVPMMALLVLLAVAASRHGGLSASRRSFVAVAVPSVVWLVVQVGIVASQFAGRVQERNMFHVVPLLLLALVVWLDCGLPRPRRAVVVATGLVAAAVVAVPYVELLNPALVNDTFGLVPPPHHRRRFGPRDRGHRPLGRLGRHRYRDRLRGCSSASRLGTPFRQWLDCSWWSRRSWCSMTFSELAPAIGTPRVWGSTRIGWIESLVGVRTWRLSGASWIRFQLSS